MPVGALVPTGVVTPMGILMPTGVLMPMEVLMPIEVVMPVSILGSVVGGLGILTLIERSARIQRRGNNSRGFEELTSKPRP